MAAGESFPQQDSKVRLFDHLVITLDLVWRLRSPSGLYYFLVCLPAWQREGEKKKWVEGQG